MTQTWTWFLWLVSLLSVGHILLYKRDARAAIGWIALCLALPGYGALCYWLLGVNRIRRRAQSWLPERSLTLLQTRRTEELFALGPDEPILPDSFVGLYRLANRVTRRPLLHGNRVTPLFNGEEAYPAMLDAIAAASESIELSSYIFENNDTGRRFAEALLAATERGVQVRVLVDALGERYSWPTIGRVFRRSAVRYARFLPLTLSGRGLYFNLRSHGKLLVIDHQVGFTGGMNIGDRHLVELPPQSKRVHDLHFQVEGPIVSHLRQAFAENWLFATGEELPPSTHLPTPTGNALCRGISAGPDEQHDKLLWILLGALHCARRRVQIMTPYFVPDRVLINALNAAALRGVQVEVILPSKSNLPVVQWASRGLLWELLSQGVHIFAQPSPFVHSKLLLVDETLALVGSANLDPRSLRLNFEFNLGVYDLALAARLSAHFDATLDRSRPLTLEDVDGRPLPVKLRDGAAKLLSPYL